jgi:ABC-type bacteriocin/lantibiotic exporter with double-glycine peptidase domain
MSEINYAKVSSPINRVASICFMLFTDFFGGMLPALSFAIIVGIYMFFINPYLGGLYWIGNIILFLCIWANWNTIFVKNSEYEKYASDNENYILEILHNIDKIIFRGQVNNEVGIFREKTKEAIEKAIQFYFGVEHIGMILNFIITVLVLLCIWFAMALMFSKRMSPVYFITFMTIILLYRDKMLTFVQMVPDFIEFIGRTNSVLKHFKQLKTTDTKQLQKYNAVSLPFHKIEFRHATFQYQENSAPLFSNLNLVIRTDNHQIIGITGLSGKGKSTIVKLMLKLYALKEGKIYIDDCDIQEVDPDYIRQNITYVNQTGKLFDRKIIENIMYGCGHNEKCQSHLKEIMERPKIKELFKDMDIFEKSSGALGENLSGGQRQVVNIIGGIINPSKILVLDEPTNALDGGLKQEIIQLIKDYKKEKHAIIVITHDRDLFPVLDEKIEI